MVGIAGMVGRIRELELENKELKTELNAFNQVLDNWKNESKDDTGKEIYKTYEILKFKNRKFERLDDGLVLYIDFKGELRWDSGYKYLNINDNWIEYRESVNFITAITEGKIISVKTDIDVGDNKRGNLLGIYNRTVKEMLSMLNDYNQDIITNIITNGKWYIGEHISNEYDRL